MNLFSSSPLFWGLAAVCVLLALAFVLPALLRARKTIGAAERRDINIAVYRDQLKELEADRTNGLIPEAQYQAALQELELRLADDAMAPDAAPETVSGGVRGLGYALAAALPVAAFGLYFWLGNPAALQAPAPGMAGSGDAHDIMAMIGQVEERARSNPDDVRAWEILGRTYAALERWADSQKAYEQALRLRPDTPELMTGYAEVLALAGNGNLKGRPMELVRKALEIDPDDAKGLELAGLNAFQDGNFAQAGDYFKRLHALLPPDSEFAGDVLAAQQEAERRAQTALSGLDSLAAPPAASAPAAVDARIEGRIEIAASLKAKVNPGDTLFLFARSPQGGPPVAALRASAAALPLDFHLDDSMAISPANALSGQQRVTLVARVSRSGDAGARPGDLEGSVADVEVGARSVRIVVDRALP
jgi:cytochrome c-type biogenesis protein CcmH